jgi:hypothetical protein
MTKMICGNWRCGWAGSSDDLLYAPNPFEPDDTIRACPKCKDIDNSLHTACEIDGCKRYGEGGYPLADGRYVWRCFEHRPAADEMKNPNNA